MGWAVAGMRGEAARAAGLSQRVISQGLRQALSHHPVMLMIADTGGRRDRMAASDKLLRHGVEGSSTPPKTINRCAGCRSRTERR